jgi:hypothetical protein
VTHCYVIRTLTLLCALYGTGRQNIPPFGPILNHLYPVCTVAPFLKNLFQYCGTVYVSYFPHDHGLLMLSETIRLCRAALFGGPRKCKLHFVLSSTHIFLRWSFYIISSVRRVFRPPNIFFLWAQKCRTAALTHPSSENSIYILSFPPSVLVAQSVL